MVDATSATTTDQRSEQEVREAVRALVLELAPAPEGAEQGEGRLAEDLGFHSLALLELAFALEDEFDLPPIDEGAARTITTIGRVQDHVVDQLRTRGAIRTDS
jgi:acyl carrier protein